MPRLPKAETPVEEVSGRTKELQEKAFNVIENILTENTSPKNDVQQKMLETAIKLYEAFK